MRKLAMLLALTVSASATAKSPFLGTWKKTAGEASVVIKFKEKEVSFKINVEGATIEAVGNYGVTKENVIFGIITKLKQDDTGQAPGKGTLFSFQLSLTTKKGDKFKLSKLTPAEGDEKALVEGVYTKVKGK